MLSHEGIHEKAILIVHEHRPSQVILKFDMRLQPESELRQHLPHRVDDLCLELGFVCLHVLLPCLLISKWSSATLLKGLL